MGLPRLKLIALDIPFLTIHSIVNFEVFFLKSSPHRYGALERPKILSISKNTRALVLWIVKRACSLSAAVLFNKGVAVFNSRIEKQKYSMGFRAVLLLSNNNFAQLIIVERMNE